MRRLATIVPTLVLGLVLAGCGGSDSADPDAGASSSAPAGSTGSTASPAAADAEAAFLRLTAEHLCAVQGSVFDDPADLAAAYEQAPDYPGLSADQVAELEERVLGEPALSAALIEALADACG